MMNKAIIVVLSLAFPMSIALAEQGQKGMMDMQMQMQNMDKSMGQARQTRDPEKHYALMQEHMQEMRQGMNMMNDMMGGRQHMMQNMSGGVKGSGMGMQGGMMGGGMGMQGGGKQGKGQADMMSPEMTQQRMHQMNQRMDMMQMMMDQMMDHQQEIQRMHRR
jgi:hypothetical protein